MSETKKPLLAEALGKEVGEVFVFTGGDVRPILHQPRRAVGSCR